MSSIPLARLAREKNPRLRSITLARVGASSSIERELASVLLWVVSEWQEFGRTVLSPAYDRPARFFSDSDGSRLQWLIDQKNADINRRIIYQTDRLRRWVTRLGQWHGGRMTSAVRSATGVNVELFIRMDDVRDILEDGIARNVSLIRGLSTETQQRVSQVVFESFALRRTKRDFVRELARVMGVSQRRARFVAEDQTTKITAILNQFRQQQLGFSQYVWRTRRDRRVRPAHRAREGLVFRWDSPPPDGHPGFAVRCRCDAEAYMELAA